MDFNIYHKRQLKIYFLAVSFFITGHSVGQSLLENTQVRFYTDAGFTLARDSSQKLGPAFLFGGVEMLVTSQITDEISLLAEPVLRPDGTISMERVMIKYSFRNYLNLSAGRLYTPIGLWNTTFFRYAKALTPTIDAPQIIANFEEGGAAINKDDGIQISGDDISKLRLGYRIMIGNGYNQPNSRHKLFIGNVFIEPVDDLRFSVSFSHQQLMPSPLIPIGLTLDAGALSIMYMSNKSFEFASEFHRAHVKSPFIEEPGSNIYYAYAGYKIKNITPYAHYYSGIVGFTAENTSAASIGFRYNFNALSVLKTEAQFLESDDFSKLKQLKILLAIGF